MNMPPERIPSRYQPPPHRRKTPSFSSSLLDSILRSIDESNLNDHPQLLDNDLTFFASQPKRSTAKINFTYQDDQMPSLRRAIMIDQWMDTDNNNNNNGYVYGKSCRKFSSDSSCSGTTSTETSDTPSTYRSLPNSFTISRKAAEAVFLDDTQKTTSCVNSSKREGKFMKLTKLRAMKIYGDLKKVKQPISPGSRISAFIYSLFASSKKSKIEESMQSFRSLKKSRSIKHDKTPTPTPTPITCTSFSRSCMSKKQHGVKRSVRFYPENETAIPHRKSTHERDNSDTTMGLPKYERRWFAEKNYTKNYKDFRVNNNEDDEEDEEEEDEDDLFELEIVGGVATGAYRQELPVFETTDLRKIRI